MLKAMKLQSFRNGIENGILYGRVFNLAERGNIASECLNLIDQHCPPEGISIVGY